MYKQFKAECLANIEKQSADTRYQALTREWQIKSFQHKYMYNFESLGRPIIQYPQDMAAIQELIWETKPDLIIETGIAHGGSLILNASMLALLDLTDAITEGRTLNPSVSGRKVLGIDIDIRKHNRDAIEAHPLFNRIQMIEGSSIDKNTIETAKLIAAGYQKVMVCLDSNHTHEHVLAELEAYGSLTSAGCYCVVFDTLVNDLPADTFPNRPWDPDNNPKTAVHEFLNHHPEFEIDRTIHNKLLITAAPDGYLKRIS